MITHSDLLDDPRIKVVAELNGGRSLVQIPLSLIATHPLLSKIRGKSPDITRLSASMVQTAGVALYQPLLLAEMIGDKINYYVADGHQRVQAERLAKAATMYVQVVTRWKDAEEAFRDCVSVQYARFEMGDIDLFSILREGKLSDQELANMTGKGATSVARMRKVCAHEVMVKLIDEKAMSTNICANLVDECKTNPTKLTALMATLNSLMEKHQAEANHYRNKYKINGTPKKRELADLAKLSYYFQKVDWSGWYSAIEAVAEGDTSLTIAATPSAKAEIEVSDSAKVWDEQIPIYFQGGNRHGDMTTANLRNFRDSLPMIANNLDAILARREDTELRRKHPIPPANPVIEVDPPAAPEDQSAEMSVDDDDAGFTE